MGKAFLYNERHGDVTSLPQQGISIKPMILLLAVIFQEKFNHQTLNF